MLIGVGDPGNVRLLRVHGIKFAVFCVGRIESDGNDAGRIARVGYKFRENIRETNIRSEFPGGFVQNVDGAALIVDENREAASGAFAGSERKEVTRPSSFLKSIAVVFRPCVGARERRFA